MSTVLDKLHSRTQGAMTKPGKDMRAAIATAHSAAYYAAIKERTGVMPKGLSKIERAELKARVAEQLKYYDRFAEQAGDMSEAAVAARAQMYAGAIRGTYFQSRYPGLSQYPGDGSTQCLTNCKCNLDERDDGIYWVLNAGESCGDCETMAANSPYGLDETKAVKAQTDQERAMFARMDGGKGPGKGYDKSKSILKSDKDKAQSGGGGAAASAESAPAHPPLHQELGNVEKELRTQRTETAHVFAEDGTPLYSNDGGKDYVEFSDAAIAKFKGKNAVLTHNHPGGWDYPKDDPRHNGNSFSHEDMQMAVHADLKEIRAVTPTRTYTMKRPAGGWDSSATERAYTNANSQTRAKFTDAIRAKRMTIAEAEAQHTHEVWQQVSKAIGADYKVEG